MIPVNKSYIIDDAIALTMYMSTTSTDTISDIIDDGDLVDTPMDHICTPMETTDGASTPAEAKADVMEVNQLHVLMSNNRTDQYVLWTELRLKTS